MQENKTAMGCPWPHRERKRPRAGSVRGRHTLRVSNQATGALREGKVWPPPSVVRTRATVTKLR